MNAEEYMRDAARRLQDDGSEVAHVTMARAAATARPKRQFAAFLLPAIVDLGSGQTLSYEGPIVWGAIYGSWLRARLSAALPAPAPR